MATASSTREQTQPAQTTDKAPLMSSRGLILLVEDDPLLAQLETDILAAHGYTVTQVESGELALKAFRETAPDLVLLDLDLPGAVNGWDVLRGLRTYAGTSTTPVLLTSAEAWAQRRLRTCGEPRSMLDHLPKPYPISTLLKRIERMLHMTP
ncbi:MAG TPA: response regulator [Ktedonobacteraceae bacterium]|nr:response regulator [Ktedonobacteraceae bacterium]